MAKTTPYNGRMNKEKVERRMTTNPIREKRKPILLEYVKKLINLAY
jgi:hypothetical protein